MSERVPLLCRLKFHRLYFAAWFVTVLASGVALLYTGRGEGILLFGAAGSWWAVVHGATLGSGFDRIDRRFGCRRCGARP